jgi:hypothetical protein
MSNDDTTYGTKCPPSSANFVGGLRRGLDEARRAKSERKLFIGI